MSTTLTRFSLSLYLHLAEPNTVMYTLMKSDKRPLFYNIIERYRDKDRDFVGTHRSSAQFQAFRSQLKALQDEGRAALEGESYVDV
jgi:quinol monooxygenase YgiN